MSLGEPGLVAWVSLACRCASRTQGVIQLGAEGVHGNTTLLTRFSDAMGWERVDNFVTSQVKCCPFHVNQASTQPRLSSNFSQGATPQGDGGPSEAAIHGGIGLYFFKSTGRAPRTLRYDSTDPAFR